MNMKWDNSHPTDMPRNEVRGFLLNAMNDTQWRACYDLKVLLAAPYENVLWVTTTEEAVLKLEQRFPSTISGLSRIDSTDGFKECVCVYNTEVYAGNDTDKAAELARIHGEITISSWRLQQLDHQLLKRNCVIKHTSTTHPKLVYNPKLVKAKLKRQENVKIRRTVPVYAVDHVVNQMRTLLLQKAGIDLGRDRENHRYRVYHNFKSYVTLFNNTFGKNAHRQIQVFQDLKNDWKLRQKASERTWLKAGECFKDFVDWMNDESTRRKPKAKELVSKYNQYAIFPKKEKA